MATQNSPTENKLGTGAEKWLMEERHVDMTGGSPSPSSATVQTDMQSLTFDIQRSIFIVIDMVNDFCSTGGWADQSGFDVNPDRKPIEPLKKILPKVRQAGMRVLWLNWGNRADLLNMAPNQLHIFNKTGKGLGLGDPLKHQGTHVLQKDSWSAEVVEELEPHSEDIRVDKYRMSGFWDTPLDSILRNLDIRTIFFSGVNTDQCVMCTLQDASFLGYGCVLVSDCCGTPTPDFCVQATLFNVKYVFGFVTDSNRLVQALNSNIKK